MSVVAGLIKTLARRFGIEIVRLGRGDGSFKHTQTISLRPKGRSRGNVLLSYIIDPFLLKGAPVSNDHTHYFESYQIAKSFLDRGFALDIISYRNGTWVPLKEYAYFIAARTNLERIANLLNASCVKVAHLDTAHWLFNNTAAHERLHDLQQRRGITLSNAKMVDPNWAIESADLGTVLGNQFTTDTYQYADKPIHRIPISAPCVYPWDHEKDFDRSRNHYVWFGSNGFVHKGLDLALEAFSQMPEFHLSVCGPFDQEPRFMEAFHKELYETPNIHALGWVDVAGPEFRDFARQAIGLVYPTCSEGGGGSVITCMHAGLVPIISYEASVDVHDTGTILERCSVEEIKEQVERLSCRPAKELQECARGAWELARRTHTRERFATNFDDFVDAVLLPGKRH